MKDPCKSCVCSSCKLSAINGNLYGCKDRRCKACESRALNITLGYCTKVIELEQLEGEIIKVW